MARSKPPQSYKRGPQNLEARIVSAIASAGPRNVARISRMTGTHQETIRYKVKKRFGRLGLRFHAEVDFAKLGLAMHWGELEFSEAYRDKAQRILRTLNRVGYLTYFGKVVPQGNFVILVTLPQHARPGYGEFLTELCEKGILTSFSLNEVLVERYKQVDPHFFNFRSGRWEIEWNRIDKEPASPLVPLTKIPIEDFDRYDLLIIKELQRDPLQHLTEVARILKVQQKTLEYHYRAHVNARRLIPSYNVRWAQDIRKSSVHSVVIIQIIFHRLTKFELAEVQPMVSKIPLLWVEDLLQNGTYVAAFHVPLTDIVELSSYVSSAVQHVASKVELDFIDPSESAVFTLPYNLYQEKEWKFSLRQLESAVQSSLSTSLQ